jgi:hypothetical protein
VTYTNLKISTKPGKVVFLLFASSIMSCITALPTARFSCELQVLADILNNCEEPAVFGSLRFVIEACIIIWWIIELNASLIPVFVFLFESFCVLEEILGFMYVRRQILSKPFTLFFDKLIDGVCIRTSIFEICQGC